jgi:hypothetical protein
MMSRTIDGIRSTVAIGVSYSIDSENSTRRSCIRLKLRMRLLSRSAFEKTSCSPLTLRTRVVLRPTCSTVPLNVSTAIVSPTTNGLSRTIEKAANRSPRMF